MSDYQLFTIYNNQKVENLIILQSLFKNSVSRI